METKREATADSTPNTPRKFTAGLSARFGWQHLGLFVKLLPTMHKRTRRSAAAAARALRSWVRGCGGARARLYSLAWHAFGNQPSHTHLIPRLMAC
jgi:hypothetical protein